MNCVNYTFGETSGCAHDLSIKYTIFGQIQWGEAIWRSASFHNATPRLNLPERGMQTPIGTASYKKRFFVCVEKAFPARGSSRPGEGQGVGENPPKAG